MNILCLLRTILILGVVTFNSILLGQDASSGQTNAPGLRVRSVFRGGLSLNGPSGELNIPVAVYGVSIAHHQKVGGFEWLKQGLALIRFKGGQIETTVGDKKLVTATGDSLLLGPEATPVFRATDESATLDAYVFGGTLSGTNSAPARVEPRRPRPEKFQQSVGEPLTMLGLAPLEMGDFYLETRDLLVGPSQRTGSFELPGAGVLEVKSGQGSLRMQGKSQNILAGTVLTVKQGQSLELTNQRDDLGLSIRATILRLR